MATIHNPTNFEPKDYEVVDYLDNQRPTYCGETVEDFANRVQAWEADNERALGADWRAKLHHCIHCGNGTVRWITAVEHKPTGERVVFGAICTQRLGFADRFAFKLAQLQARAEARKVRFTIWTKRQEYLQAHPEIAQALEVITEPAHAKNFFAQDVLRKLDQYGDLSDKQAAAVVASLARDRETAARKALEATEVKGEAPVGRVEVVGEVLTIKVIEGDYGTQVKTLLKLANNAKVWLTLPSAAQGGEVTRGDVVRIKASFEQSRDDKSFGFGKRPIFIGKETKQLAVAS